MTSTSPERFLDEFRGREFNGRWPALPRLFSITVRRFPDRPAFTIFEDSGRRSLTYRQAQERVQAVAGALIAKGVGPGRNVALRGHNSPEWALAYLGILWAGCVVVPLDQQLKTEEAAHLCRTADADALFADEEDLPVLAAQANFKAVFPLESLGELPPSSTPAADLRETDTAALLFTSGTMGTPKGVVLTHVNLVSDCFLAQRHMAIFPTDVFYALLPLHHTYCMLAVFIEAVSVGAEVVFARKMAVSSVLHDLKAARITMFLGVPLLFNKILSGILGGLKEKGLLVYAAVRLLMFVSGLVKKTTGINPGKRLFRFLLDKASLSTLRICISGGGPLAPSVFRKFNQLGLDFVQGYGLTETSPILALNPVHRYKENSVGKLLEEVEYRIDSPDETGQGELVVRGSMVMKGYYRNPEATAQVLTADGWLHTGDVGRIDGEGYLYLTGRAKSLIVTEGGKNVYPEEIEYAFQLSPQVDQVLVRGYLQDAALKSEGIEALIYPNKDFLKEHAARLDRPLNSREVQELVEKAVSEVNSKLLPYQRISKLTILETPLEMTTTRKVRRLEAAVK